MEIESKRQPPQKFSAYIIGNSSLCIECGSHLLEQSHQIIGIATSDLDVEKWAKNESINCLFFAEGNSDSQQLFEFFNQRPFDYLFSVDNAVILGDDILDLPQKMAINYHDGPLPRYGGLNATNWAIYNQESSHGVTWHVIANQIDAGDILKHRSVDISDHETALTLNGKCYESAIFTFKELVSDLANGSLKRQPQDLSQRTYFASHQRPTAACIIDWSQSAHQISALVRALDHGVYPNYLGAAKALIAGEVVLVDQIEVLDVASEQPAGTILTIDPDQMVVATADFDVALSRFQEQTGVLLDPVQIGEQFQLVVGDRLPDHQLPSQRQVQALTKVLQKHEPYWVKRLSELEPVQLPYVNRLTPENDQKQEGRIKGLSVEIPDEVRPVSYTHLTLPTKA